ncbi:TonB-dependent receptor [Kangiella sp. TOML190]|uniref:TonB-dependent receptor n=1 Tax=Kangiella sp. TOML190 TaxID=2931351 RepID=UPI00204123B5|nr:TonB-dependent receptor [Kangiella sp. TOML190]
MKAKNSKFKYSAIGLSVLSVLFANSLAAAEANSEPEADSAKDSADVIHITARRVQEDPQKVPVSVSYFTDEALEEAGVQNITHIENYIPNATFNASRGTNSTLTAYIRGVGQNDPLWGFEPGVGVYIDDVYVARPQGAVLDILDIDRIEVLRGPQGTLYGKNTIGGALKYVTKELTPETEFTAQLGVGNFGQLDFKIGGQTALGSDKWMLGYSFASLNRDGFGEVKGDSAFAGDDLSDKDVLAGRLNLTYAHSDDLRFKLVVDRIEDDSNARGGGRLTTSNVSNLPPLSDVHDTRQNLDPDRNEVNTSGEALTINWNINDRWSFKSVSAQRRGDTTTDIDFDQLNINDFDVPATYDDEQLTQEFQFAYNQGNLNGVFGYYYYDGEAKGSFDVLLGQILGGLGFSTTTSGVVDTRSHSVYGQGSYQFDDQWSMSFGGRYTHDDKRAYVNVLAFLGVDTSVAPFQVRSNFNNDETFDNFSPHLGVQYQMNDDVMLYSGYSQGFKSGGFNMRANQAADPGADQPFKEETVDQIEFGVKSTLLDDRLQLNAVVFYQDYDDKQVTTNTNVDLDNDGINETFVGRILNAGRVEAYGLEVETLYSATDNLKFFFNLGLLDADYKEFDGFDVTGNRIDPDDINIINTPETTANLGFNYQIPMASGAYWLLNANAAYRDDVKIFDLDSPVDQSGYTLVDAAVSYITAEGDWRFTLSGRNLTDKEYRTGGYFFPDLGVEGTVTGYYGDPRTYTLTATYSFF